MSDTFGTFAERLGRHYDDIRIEPPPWRTPPAIQRLLLNVAVPEITRRTKEASRFLEKNQPLLAGDLMRAVLTGTPYPRTLLVAALMRLRAGDDPSTGWHAAAVRAVLARQHRRAQQVRRNFTPTTFDPTKEPPMSLSRESNNLAYTCGRLFAALEAAQRSALGKVNATIRDRYIGAASATPANVFPLLIKNAQSHLGKMRKAGKGGWLERELEDIHNQIDFEDERGFPRTLRLEEQGRFFLGYYHQRKAQFAKAKEAGEEHIEEQGIDAHGQ